MYNADKPSLSELPTSAQLLRSTAAAIAVALAILVTVVLPAEYGIDPTGTGRILGLTEMGKIKMQLAEEVEADRRKAAEAKATSATDAKAAQSASPARPQNATQSTPATKSATRKDEISITLKPGEGAEVKLEMEADAEANFEWSANEGKLNYDTHGDGGGKNISYEKGRGVARDEGVIKAAFKGNHGWFWRNRTNKNVTMTLRTAGAYRKMKRLK